MERADRIGFPGRECVALISDGLVETCATLTISEIAVAFRGHAFAALHGDGSARPMIFARSASFRDSTVTCGTSKNLKRMC